jgi:hypothetical protein
MRSKLLYVVKNLSIVHHANTTNRQIFAFLKDTETRDNLKKVDIENPKTLMTSSSFLVDNILNDLGIYASMQMQPRMMQGGATLVKRLNFMFN